MKLEEVIKAGEGIQSGFAAAGSIFGIIVGVFSSIFLLFLVLDMKNIEDEKARISSKSIQKSVIGLIVLSTLVAVSGYVADNKYRGDVKEFKTEIAYPYIESLPDNRSDIISIEKKENTSKTFSIFSTSDSEYGELVAVKFKDRKGFTNNLTGEVKIVNTDEKQPYLTYKRVPKDLGAHVNEGYYNVVIHMSKPQK